MAQISTRRRKPVARRVLTREYTNIIDGPLAQLVEQLTLNQ